jgi:3-oxoacyl-[acyl-carrier-protein] synthase II
VSRRAVITGIGAITPIGHTVNGLRSGLRRGRSAVRRVTRFDASHFRSQLAAEIDDFHPLDWMEPRASRRLDRFAQFGVAAARQALEDADFMGHKVDRDRVGVSVGSALGGVAFGEGEYARYIASGIRSVSPNLALAVYGGASGANIALQLDFHGPNQSNSNSCASGAVAVGEALRTIRCGEADIVLAAGVEAPLAPLTYGAFSLIRAMSTANATPEVASRPFDADRDGFVMGEGAALLVVEELEHALRRDARIYAEIGGYGHTNDAFHMTAPRPDGEQAARAIKLAIADAGVTPGSVQYVNAHATGTVRGDAAEACAIRRALGPTCAAVSATKGLYGHPLGASGAIEAAITVLALFDGFLPGTTNLNRLDTACAIDVLRFPAARQIDVALSTSFGFGGVNAALIFRRWEN